MNKVFVSGVISKAPLLRVENGNIPHLVMSIRISHKTRDGETHKETYRLSAWNGVAQWGIENLSVGQIIAVQGYLTQRKAKIGNDDVTMTEIAAEEFIPSTQTSYQVRTTTDVEVADLRNSLDDDELTSTITDAYTAPASVDT